MKTTKLLILTILISLNTAFAQENMGRDSDFSLIEGPYLGQKPPGSTAEVFAPNIIQTKCFEAFGVFTPDLKEFYYISGCDRKSQKLVAYKQENNIWSKSIVGSRVGEPAISPDGKIMYLGEKYMERTNTGWSEVKTLEAPFKDIPIMRLTVSSKGTYYFDYTGNADGEGLIRSSRLIDGKREVPVALSKEINSGKLTAHPFIAPDESYLIWDSVRDDGYGRSDLYISYRQKNGSWGKAINLGNKINSEYSDVFGNVTPDGKYLFFYRGLGSGNLDIYWVDAQVIETLRPKQKTKK